MSRVDRAWTRVAATVEPGRLDFWIKVLHAHPDDDVQAAGDMLEERNGDPFAVRITQVLERRFGETLRRLVSRHQETAVVQFVLGNLFRPTFMGQFRRDDSGLEWFVRRLRLGLPIYVRLSIRGAPVPLSSLHPGQRFRREADPAFVWTLRSRGSSGAAAVCERRSGTFGKGELVYLEPETSG
jgi:hypothetical protein